MHVIFAIKTLKLTLKITLNEGPSIAFSIFTSVQRVLFLHTPSLPPKAYYKMLIGYTSFMYEYCSLRPTFLKAYSYKWIYPLP